MTYALRTRRKYAARTYGIPPHYTAVQSRMRATESAESGTACELGLLAAAILAASVSAILLIAI
jgi:hypothetical protein